MLACISIGEHKLGFAQLMNKKAKPEKQQRAQGKPLYILHGEIRTPPLSNTARRIVGFQLRRLQQGQTLSMPISRPMPTIEADCHELRISDAERNVAWRVIYCIDTDAVVVLEVFEKKTQETPEAVKRICRERLRRYFELKEGK